MPNCLVCGTLIEKKSHESVARYNNKKFCSPIHCRQYMKENKIGWYKGNQKVIGAIPKRKWYDLEDRSYINEGSRNEDF